MLIYPNIIDFTNVNMKIKDNFNILVCGDGRREWWQMKVPSGATDSYCEREEQ